MDLPGFHRNEQFIINCDTFIVLLLDCFCNIYVLCFQSFALTSQRREETSELHDSTIQCQGFLCICKSQGVSVLLQHNSKFNPGCLQVILSFVLHYRSAPIWMFFYLSLLNLMLCDFMWGRLLRYSENFGRVIQICVPIFRNLMGEVQFWVNTNPHITCYNQSPAFRKYLGSDVPKVRCYRNYTQS